MANKFLYVGGRDDDGIAKGARVDVDGKLKVHGLVGSRPFSTGSNGLKLTVNAGETLEVYRLESALMLENLVWVTDNQSLSIIIKKVFPGGEFITVGDIQSAKSGGDNTPLSPRNILSQSSSFFKINIYETDNYKFSLDKEMRFPNGIVIEVRNGSAQNALVSVRGSGVIYD